MDTKTSLENKIVSSARDLDNVGCPIEASKKIWISPTIQVTSVMKITKGGATATPEFDGGFLGS